MSTEKRKMDHIRACLTKDVSFSRTTGFERYDLVHNPLPEINLDDVDMSVSFLGRKLSAPLVIGAMTGGTREAGKINRNLAKAAQELGIGMFLGSQRAMIENPKLASTFSVRDVAPDIFLAGNIGASHISGSGASAIDDALDKVGADALAVHLNPAQEIAQHDGHEKWKGILASIKKLRSGLKRPLIVKEVGCGIPGEKAVMLEQAGADAIDVAGAGGTSWVKVDSFINGKKLDNFFDWGIPTASCLDQCAGRVKIPVIASGGIRTGVDIAKALARGAWLAGIALPLLKPATKSSGEVVKALERVLEDLRTAMFLTGSRRPGELAGKAVKI